LQRAGYRVEKLVLQTRPGLLMTANAYVPDGVGRRAAVLCVHGHWSGAKQDPVVQARCIGLCKLGFFVLSVDAFGAGERGVGRALGEYHGAMVAATLWPTGLALAGLQVYDNMRAVDYLQSRPEVDPERIGVTGTSGGGNQTMYLGAVDDRLKCVVPACSVGTYQAYLGAACCMCEVTPAALTYTEEWGLLAMVAPRALMLINATRDAFQFSVGEAKKSLTAARKIYGLYGKSDHARHAIFESKHDYNRPMREAMYGWMTLHLKQRGDGSPITEAEFQTEDPADLRCFPGETRPADFMTLPQFAAAEARRQLRPRAVPGHLEHWQAERMFMEQALPRVLGKSLTGASHDVRVIPSKTAGELNIELTPEPGLVVRARHQWAAGQRKGLVLLLDLDAGIQAATSPLVSLLRKSGWDVLLADLRGTGAASVSGDRIGSAPDHNSAEWSMWIGRPLLGQWIRDISCLLDAVDEHVKGGLPAVTVAIGSASAGVVAMAAAAVDSRLSRVATLGTLSSYVSSAPYQGQRLGIIVPGILREVGDLPHLAALLAPRRLVMAAAVDGSGRKLTAPEWQQAYTYTRSAYRLEEAPRGLRYLETSDPKSVVAELA
jgi:dienelactone hydrolase